MTKITRRVLLSAGVVIVSVAIISMVLHLQFASDPHVQRFRALEGKTESEVRSVLGEPQRVHEKATAPTAYYEKGYTYDPRPISNKVFIYFADPDLIAYVYFDLSNRVEHVFVGAS